MESLFSDLLTKEMPAGWTSSRLGACLDLVRNGLSLEQNQEGRGVRVTRIETISKGIINTEKVGFVETDGDISEYLLKRGDVLFSHINSIKHIGKVAQFDNDEELYHGMNLLVLQFNGKVDKRFGYYFLASQQTKSICERMAKQAVNQASINTKEIRQLPIALPPLLEQRKIAEILSTADTTIEKTDAVIQETQQLKKGLMQKLFTEGIGHTRFKDTEIGRIPEEWTIKPLSKLVGSDKLDFTDGDWIESPYITSEGIRLIQTGNVGIGSFLDTSRRYVSEQTFVELKCKEVYSGDMLICRLAAPIGRACIVPDTGEKYITAVDCTIVRPDSTIVDKYYLKHFINWRRTLNLMERYGGGVAHQRISRKNLAKILIPIPPLSEQYKIAEILSAVDLETEREHTFKDELEQLKKGLMQVLLTGKVRVKV